MEMESDSAGCCTFGTATTTSFSSFDWAVGEELGESTGTSYLDDIIDLGETLDGDNTIKKMAMKNGDDKCFDSVNMAKGLLSTSAESTFNTKYNPIRTHICDSFSSSNKPACCDSTSSPCDTSLCFKEEGTKDWSGNGQKSKFSMTVSSATKYVEADVSIKISKASLCLITGNSTAPLKCFSEKSCHSLEFTIDKVCEETDFDDCGNGDFKNNVDTSTDAWDTAKTAKAPVLTSLLCGAK